MAVLSVSVPISCRMSRPLCLLASGRFSLRLDADGGGGLRSVGSAGGLLACLSRRIRAVPPLVALSFHLMGCPIDAALCRCPDVVGMSSGAVMLYRASSNPSRLSVA